MTLRVLLLLLAATGASAAAQPAIPPRLACADLAGLDLSAELGVLARVDATARLFLVPGLAHCRGGAGSFTEFDTLALLLRWAEESIAPDGPAGGRVASTGDVASEPLLGAERFGPRRQQVPGDSR